jgi:probable HAF family extracellular repeat protein
MKRWCIPFAITAVLAGAAAAQAASVTVQYHVIELPTLGGSFAQGSSINQFGLIAGFSTLADNQIHATAWRSGIVQDLGTLGGAGSAVLWPVKNDAGVISGIAQTDQPNPLGEPWSCSGFIAPDGHACLGFVYHSGTLRGLQPLPGGYNSFATGTNNLMQTVGWAETGLHDANCDPNSGQVLQFLPVIWGPGDNAVTTLPLKAGDDSGAATAINDRGQVTGISGTCDQAVGRSTAMHMLLWQGGGYTDLGNLGGDAWNTPMAINERGEVVGFANVSTGTALNENAFLWTQRDGIRSLGVLYPADVHSQALGINNRDQVVGLSCTAHFASCHGFLWQNGSMADLDALAPDYPGTIVDAQDINDLGEITGQAQDASGNLVGFLAIPLPSWNAPAGRATTHDADLTPKARAALLQRLGLSRPAAMGQIH